MSTPGSFCWLDLNAHDWDGQRTFWQALLGWTWVDAPSDGGPGRYGFFQRAGQLTAGAGEVPPHMQQGAPTTWNHYVCVSDVHATADQVVTLGGTVLFPPQQAGESGWFAFFVDPEGATFAVWQPGTHTGAVVSGGPGHACWWERPTRDMEAAQAFYGALFRWLWKTPPQGGDGVVIIRNGDQEIGHLMRMDEQWGDMPAAWSAYFSVEDCDVSTARAVALGGSVCVPPFDLPVGRTSVIADPLGVTTYLIALKPG
jgi:predicted enzyme related to lactoylglutathione lyase